MLIFSCLVAAVVLNFSYCTAAISIQELPINTKKNQGTNALLNFLTPKTRLNRTKAIYEGSENLYLIPTMEPYIRIPKRRNIKKSPKRTIQKIIKKAKKSKRMYLNQMTSQTTVSSPVFEDKDEETVATTVPTHAQKKKLKKAKYLRFPVPFQKLQAKKEVSPHHRMRRDTNRDVYILQDLDEIQFLSNEDGTNAVMAHVKNYW